MVSIVSYLEYVLGKLLAWVRGHDSKLFINVCAGTRSSEPTIALFSPECGSSGSALLPQHKKTVAALSWPRQGPEVKEYLLVVEDPDAPFPIAVSHGLYYGIPAQRTGISSSDIEPVDPSKKVIDYQLRSGIKFVPSMGGKVYLPPRPPLGHGPHRYFHQLIALREPLDVETMGDKVTKQSIMKDIQGKVAGYGVWIGIWETQWPK